jgi:hypothetical protein
MEFTLFLRLFMWVYPNTKHSSYGRSECLIRQEQPEWSFWRHFTSKKEFDFNNISAISRRSALMDEETAVRRENHRPAASH